MTNKAILTGHGGFGVDQRIFVNSRALRIDTPVYLRSVRCYLFVAINGTLEEQKYEENTGVEQ